MPYAATIEERCPTCNTIHSVDQDEDGYGDLPATKCAHATCQTFLCEGGRQELSGDCDGCGLRFCQDHLIPIFELRCCLPCAIDALEANEPDCTCAVSADQADSRGCELHYFSSPWHLAQRVVAARREADKFALPARFGPISVFVSASAQLGGVA